jgi:hypothetical protein
VQQNNWLQPLASGQRIHIKYKMKVNSLRCHLILSNIATHIISIRSNAGSSAKIVSHKESKLSKGNSRPKIILIHRLENLRKSCRRIIGTQTHSHQEYLWQHFYCGQMICKLRIQPC